MLTRRQKRKLIRRETLKKERALEERTLLEKIIFASAVIFVLAFFGFFYLFGLPILESTKGNLKWAVGVSFAITALTFYGILRKAFRKATPEEEESDQTQDLGGG